MEERLIQIAKGIAPESLDSACAMLVSCGIVSLEESTQIQQYIMAQQREEYINKKHNYKIYQGKDGKWYTYIVGDDGKRRKIKRNCKEEVQEIVFKHIKEHEDNPTIKELFNEWNDLRLKRNKISRASYDRYAQVFRRHYSSFGELRIKSVTPEDIEDFLENQIAEHHLTNKAFGLLKCTIKGILQRAKRRKVAKFNIGELLDDLDINDHEFSKSIKEDYQEVFDEEETEKVMKYCYENLDMQNTAILLTFVTGLRVGELVTLKHEDIKANCISIRRTETRYEDPDNKGHWVYDVKEFPKTKAGVREVAIPKDYQFLLSKMKTMNPFGEYIFTDKSNKRITTNVIRRRQERICKHLGIYRKSPHKIRKTVNTIYMDYKLDNNLIKGQMGWSNISVGENHYHRNRKSIEKKVDIISSIPEFQMSKFGN